MWIENIRVLAPVILAIDEKALNLIRVLDGSRVLEISIETGCDDVASLMRPSAG